MSTARVSGRGAGDRSALPEHYVRVAETNRMNEPVRDGDAELREMDLIEAYRNDESVRPVIRPEPSN